MDETTHAIEGNPSDASVWMTPEMINELTDGRDPR